MEMQRMFGGSQSRISVIKLPKSGGVSTRRRFRSSGSPFPSLTLYCPPPPGRRPRRRLPLASAGSADQELLLWRPSGASDARGLAGPFGHDPAHPRSALDNDPVRPADDLPRGRGSAALLPTLPSAKGADRPTAILATGPLSEYSAPSSALPIGTARSITETILHKVDPTLPAHESHLLNAVLALVRLPPPAAAEKKKEAGAVKKEPNPEPAPEAGEELAKCEVAGYVVM